ncbi:hypothetical protein [Nocardioides sp. R-C-SC26]|uniref:maltokinase N-terminal cap-like domain-containing protein n=1 Tax=Nocardioides sp. R-C-SC26 TaxID=2870414 RepID=UPI001E530DE1|nr:hypothetical protein [Nocardioides sp. R-C-SC26]
MNATGPVDHPPLDVFAPYLAKTRWFGGKGRTFTVTGARRLALLGSGDPALDVLLITLSYADGRQETEHYQVPLAYYSSSQERLAHAYVGSWHDPDVGELQAYDALHDRDAARLWQSGLTSAATTPIRHGGLAFHRLPGHDLDPDAVAALFSGEQSNSSLMLGEDAVLKLFRKVTPGPNPDVTTHEALSLAGSHHVAELYGWIEADIDGVPTHLAMLQQFLRTATDGWDLACASVRDLYASPDLDADQAGGDFAAESARLGETLREVHALMASALPIAPEEATLSATRIADGMRARLADALALVPGLGDHEPRLRATFDAVAELGEVPGQHVHGDLHLGQTLRTALGWKLVDFEGEPATPLADRLRPDSPWRDVAGMLRSFDYAPHVVRHQLDDQDTEVDAVMRGRGAAWSRRNQAAFLAAYLDGGSAHSVLLTAYLADKGVYEAVYETRNRPGWVHIPLASLAQIGA